MVDYRDRAGSSERGVRNTGGASNVSPREIYRVTGRWKVVVGFLLVWMFGQLRCFCNKRIPEVARVLERYRWGRLHS